jgi:uncharacterized membrane protein
MSNFLRLKTKDFIKGTVVSILTAIGTFLYAELQKGTEVNKELFERVGIAALISFLAYIVKNLFTNNSDELFTIDKK